ncbi:MAG TPA: YciI family protein [Sphingomicrobium sp.]|nr:YciI family protein [Sphingomicrobium sp.]
MLFALMGFLKPDSEPVSPSVQVQTGDFLGQPFINVRLAGQLKDASGKRAGMMMIFEDESREAAETFVKTSPYVQAGLIEDFQLYEYATEVG